MNLIILSDTHGLLRPAVLELLRSNKKDVPADLTGADVVVFGHSHKYSEERRGDVLWLNPGSCGPRRFHQEITLMRVQVSEGSIQVEKIVIPHEVP